MNLEDLTPQLRTRIGRMERAAGWFILFSAVLLLAGFAYYLSHLAGQRGWFLTKAKFFTYLHSASGLNVGDNITLMGLQVGGITGIRAMPELDSHDIRVEFDIKEPYYNYVRSEGSVVEVTAADLLGKRQIEITRGTGGSVIYSTCTLKKFSEASLAALSDPQNWCLAQSIFDKKTNLLYSALTVLDRTNLVAIGSLQDPVLVFHLTDRHKLIDAAWDDTEQRYQDYNSKLDGPRWLRADESPTVTEEAQMLVDQVRQSLPNILALTNNIAVTLNSMAIGSSNIGAAFLATRPVMQNLSNITSQLQQPGGIADWAFGTNMDGQVQDSLTNLDALLASLAGVANNLNLQMAANSNLMSNVTTDIVDIDGFVHGLERVRLLRSAFRSASSSTNTPPVSSPSHKR
jgi:ABC-type transporter Mla subunit MlaD